MPPIHEDHRISSRGAPPRERETICVLPAPALAQDTVEPGRCLPGGAPGEQGLLGDTRGAIMVMGVFMAVLLVGMLYYIMGIGETILYREMMQDASDSGAFAAAVMHARGMNIIALMNMVMAAVLSVLVALKVVEDLLTAALIVATAICAGCGPYCGPCCAACPFVPVLAGGLDYVSGIIEDVEPIIHEIVSAVSTVADGVAVGIPIAAQAKVVETGVSTYNRPTTEGLMLPLFRRLPVEDDSSSLLCRKAGELAGRFAATAIGLWPIRRFVGTAVGGLAAAFSSHYCGESADKAKKIKDGIELGDEDFQVRAVMRGDPPFERTQAYVAIAAWGDADRADRYEALEEVARYGVAQGEFYFDARDMDRKEWMWHMWWKARLRRFRLPASLPGLPSALSGFGPEVVVH